MGGGRWEWEGWGRRQAGAWRHRQGGGRGPRARPAPQYGGQTAAMGAGGGGVTTAVQDGSGAGRQRCVLSRRPPPSHLPLAFFSTFLAGAGAAFLAGTGLGAATLACLGAGAVGALPLITLTPKGNTRWPGGGE